MLHNHENTRANKNHNVNIALLLTLAFAFVELAFGKVSNSLALIADAGHMFSDATSLAALCITAIISNKIAKNKKLSYGIGKIDVLAALFNIILVTIVIYHIIDSSISRYSNSEPVIPEMVFIVGCIGLIINIIVMKLLSELNDIGAESAKLHVIADLLGSLAAIVSALIIIFTKAYWVDVALSLLIAILLSSGVFRQIKSCVSIILDVVPKNIELDEVSEKIIENKNISGVHDLHIWRSGDEEISLTAHLDVCELDKWDTTLTELNYMLLELFGINHTTLQPESIDHHKNGVHCYH